MNILVTGAWKYTDAQLEALKALGHTVVLMPQESASLPCAPEEVEGVICNGLFLHHPIEKFTHLKYIQLTSAGFDRVPMDYIKAHGLEIHNARGVYSIPMAEHAVAGILTIYRRLNDFYEFKKEHHWEKLRDLEELSGKTVLILGCGSVGTQCAKHFNAFGARIIGVDIAKFPVDPAFQKLHFLDELDRLLPSTDILILTLPLSAATRHLIDAERLARLPNRAIIVNLARGAIVDYIALTAELSSNRLRAVLDVFEEEPLPADSTLWTLPNVVITPHVAFIGGNNPSRLAEVIQRNLTK